MIPSQFGSNQFSSPVLFSGSLSVMSLCILKGRSVTAFFNIFLKGLHYASWKILIALFLCSTLFFSCLLSYVCSSYTCASYAEH